VDELSDRQKSDEDKEVVIYTDGACEPNPGSGGFGVVLLYGKVRKEVTGGFRLTTNNRMEILAAIKGLELLKKPCKVTIYSDSQYLVKAMMDGWVLKWKKKNWWRSFKERALNMDLWERLLSLCETHQVTFVWLKGHAGNIENERCDNLSYAALRKKDLPTDEGYENKPEEPKPIKITQEGQPCPKCSTLVGKRRSRKFNLYLYCPSCQTTYEIEKEKQNTEEIPTLF
jgi:ribonuclease HI